jgi:hypothetical protein
MSRRLAILIASGLIAGLAAAPAAARPRRLSMAAGQRAIRDYARRDHPASITVRSCHRGSRTRLSCTLDEHHVCPGPGLTLNGQDCRWDVTYYHVTAMLRRGRVDVWIRYWSDDHPFSEPL